MTPIWIHHISPTISTVGHRPPPRSAKQTGSRHPHLSRSRNHIIINYIVALSLGESCRHLNLLLFLLILLITTDGGQPLPGDTRGSLLHRPPSYATAKMNYIFHPYMNRVHLPTCNVLKKKNHRDFRNVTKTSMWHGVLPGGACGMFNPNNTKPYLKTEVSNVVCYDVLTRKM